ncbi:helix-turn-helix domain-containing protein [Falsiroseomonas oryzae]|uniref:helix-turn-helix domain-containing protein n=1 Tax=Falsiroseomonas oryzae TaxID=2766473 RepID=UPI0022EA8E04|nr:helix-turn-helix domain-containing protein [Roseomonas sp. MO-31]
MACIAPVIRAADFHCVDDLAAAQRDFEAELVQLSPGRFRYGLSLVDLGPVRVQSNAVDGSYLGRARVAPGDWALFYPTGGPAEASRLNAILPGSADAVLYGPGAELMARVADGQRWTMVVLDAARFGEVFGRLPAAREGRALPLRGLLARAPELLRLPDLAGLQMAGQAGVAVSAAVVDGLRAALDGALADGPPPRRRLRGERSAVRVASAAVEYLAAVPGRPVCSEEIGTAIGVSPRFVNQCFDAVYGVSVHRYLRQRRLAEARRRLTDGGAGLLVKQVALDLGFWHFGRFALAYRDLFGETPSQTLATSTGR